MQSNLHPLPLLRQRPFREWLDSAQFNTLIDVLEAEAFRHQVDCANHMREAIDSPNYKQKAEDSAVLARDLFECVNLLQGIREQKEHKIFSVTPTKITETPTKKA